MQASWTSPPCEKGSGGAYHWNPSLQRIVKFELLSIICFEDELAVKFGEGHAGVGIEFFRILRETGSGAIGR